MAEERVFSDRPATVTVGLLDGRTAVGRMTRFRPADADLVLVSRSRAAGVAAEQAQALHAEGVAFVALHRGDAPAIAVTEGSVVLDVHVAGGQTFAVRVDPAAASDRLGFWGVPSNPSSAFSEVFFYAHGVNAREDRATIGTLLVSSGVLAGDALARGLEKQAEAKAAPIGRILVEQQKIDEADVAAAAAAQKEASARGRRLRLGEILVEAGLASEADVAAALEEQKTRRGKRIGEVLVEMGLVSELDIARTLGKKFGIPFVDLDASPPDPAALGLVPADLVQRYRVLPTRVEGTTLTIALSDPLAFEAVDMLRFTTGRRIVETVATRSQIAAHIERCAPAREGGAAAAAVHEAGGPAAVDALAETRLAAGQDEDAGASGIVDQVIVDAWTRGASDIHIEPDGEERETTVRFRVDGICEVYRRFPPSLRSRIVARIKILAGLDITEKRKPQDGKIALKIREKPVELRVATIPTVSHDEDVVLRILAAGEPIPIDGLLLSARNLSELRRIVAMPYGLVLAVGPTGSGKTTTLHSLVGSINKPERKIWTAEDPVEIRQKGLRQVQVLPRIGFDFAAALRSFLRADPDVIMVGEMRDRETATTGIEASLTGHLVFSTLHTNSAPETVTRLVDMGLDPFTFSDALLGVLAQRLARRLCSSCREEYEASEAEREELAGHYGRDRLDRALAGRPLRLFRSAGCARCGGRGYKGRLGLHELLVNEDRLRAAIQRRATVDEVRAIAVQGGMLTLLQDGIEKCLAGHTDLRQVLAVCSR